MNQILVAVILTAAVICDLSVRRIPNTLIIIGYTLGSIFVCVSEGFGSFYLVLVRAVWPILVLYLFYYFGAVGAGDIKLFSCMSVFLPFITSINIIVASFLSAAVFSFFYLLCTRNLVNKLMQVREHFSVSLMTGQLCAYDTSDDKSKVSFSVFIGFAYMINNILEVCM